MTTILVVVGMIAFGCHIAQGYATGAGVPFMDTVIFVLLSAAYWELVGIRQRLDR